MNEENKKLLDEVIKNRLKQASNSKAEDEGVNIAFKQAMDAIDRQLELSKIDDSYEQANKKQELAEQEVTKKYELAEQELEKKQKQLEQEAKKLELAEEELRKKQELAKQEAKIGWIIRIVEIVGGTVVVSWLNYRHNMKLAERLCNFEKDYTFTTSAGRSLSRCFKFGNKN